MFVVTLTYIKPVEEIDALMDAHVAWLKSHYASGLFVASGRRVPRTGGVILARSGDEAGLRAALASDPFALHQAARFDVVEFTATMTAPGAEVLKSL
ncbi:MAG TPA: YciI family protein [Burkholderiaceae bacterium]